MIAARHAADAALSLRQALHYHRFFPGRRVIEQLAAQAGQSAAYAEIEHPTIAAACVFGVVAGQALDVSAIRSAFVASFSATLAALARSAS